MSINLCAGELWRQDNLRSSQCRNRSANYRWPMQYCALVWCCPLSAAFALWREIICESCRASKKAATTSSPQDCRVVAILQALALCRKRRDAEGLGERECRERKRDRKRGFTTACTSRVLQQGLHQEAFSALQKMTVRSTRLDGDIRR